MRITGPNEGLDQTTSTETRQIIHYRQGECVNVLDEIAREAPIRIFLRQKDRVADLGFLMRTPGADEDLITGLLFSEQIIHRADEILEFKFLPESGEYHLQLDPDIPWPEGLPDRSYTATTACGVCGRTTMEQLLSPVVMPFPAWNEQVAAATISGLPELIRSQQKLFESTGGVHAAALVSRTGTLECLREDIGRHNATDKLIGASVRSGKLEAVQEVLVVSGRLAFELVQKAVVLRCPVLVAVGAPTSLAVDLAEQYGMTLIGFTGQGRFNIYTHAERIKL